MARWERYQYNFTMNKTRKNYEQIFEKYSSVTFTQCAYSTAHRGRIEHTPFFV